ncbi:MAG: VOC family protein [Candidatus Methanomethylophilaceae archaeon]|nr:VOC family protein [Candidatus Methanomethylophilaceae archaeon]
MKLKGFLIAVDDIEASRRFYEDVFGIETVQDNDGDMALTDGVFLQDRRIWERFLGRASVPRANSSELYFEEEDVDGFVARLLSLYPDTEIVCGPMTHSWGQRVVRFYDPDGNLVEVGSPMRGPDRPLPGSAEPSSGFVQTPCSGTTAK